MVACSAAHFYRSLMARLCATCTYVPVTAIPVGLPSARVPVPVRHAAVPVPQLVPVPSEPAYLDPRMSPGPLERTVTVSCSATWYAASSCSAALKAHSQPTCRFWPPLSSGLTPLPSPSRSHRGCCDFMSPSSIFCQISVHR